MKSRTVIWSVEARADVQEQVLCIADDDPDAAARIKKRIQTTGQALGTFATGHPGRVAGTYEKSIRNLPYILAYALTDQTVVILRLIHTARDWRDGDWPE